MTLSYGRRDQFVRSRERELVRFIEYFDDSHGLTDHDK